MTNKGIKKAIPYGHQSISNQDIREVSDVLRSDWLTQGKKVDEFEKALAKYCKVKYAVAVSSGTAALHAAYSAAGIRPGDEVITTPLTFAATANAIVFCGGKPVFVDIEKDTLNIDPDLIEKAITEKTKALAPVDFAGHPCDYDKILKIAKKHNLAVIEDACHAFGSLYKGKKIGSLADMTVFSFHPVKLFTTGEGGAIATNSKELYEKLKAFRHHGIIKKPENGGWYYEIENPGYNFRLTDFQCALGLSQLKKADGFIMRRREIIKRYCKDLGTMREIIIPVEKSYAKSAWHIYVIQLQGEKLINERKNIFDEFHKENIKVQVHYMPLHLHPFYKNNFGYKPGDFPVAEKYYRGAITLPLFPGMKNEEINRVVKTVKKIIWKKN